MSCYKFIISEVLNKEILIEADYVEEARDALEKSYADGEDGFVLGADDHDNTEIYFVDSIEKKAEYDVYKITEGGALCL